MTTLEPSFYDRTGRRNDKLAKGHATQCRTGLFRLSAQVSKQTGITHFFPIESMSCLGFDNILLYSISKNIALRVEKSRVSCLDAFQGLVMEF